MTPPPVPDDEARRLAALLGLRVLDTPAEAGFDDVVRLAAQLCGAPTALITLVDDRRQWFKARVGFGAAETSRDASFCAHAIVSDEPTVVPDTLADARFEDNPLVTGETGIRFYAGVPLRIGPGSAVGTLCVIDRVPRGITEAQLAALEILARQVASDLGARERFDAESRVDVGLVAGRYRIERIIGHGGMGVVAAARDVASGAQVAIKFLLPAGAANRHVTERFVREALILARIESERVTRILDAGSLANGAPYIVMELLKGRDLAAVLESDGPLGVATACRLAREACTGLAVAHAAGVIHRDLKPANLFLAAGAAGTAQLKILDFGVSLLAGEAGGRLTADAALLGTLEYMSPEQLGGAASVDERTDIWSLGVVLYELLTGRLPFRGKSPMEIFTRILTTDPAPLCEVRPEASAELASVIDACLARHRDDRIASMPALAAALEPFAGP